MKKLAHTKPLYTLKGNRSVTVLHRFPNGNLVVVPEGECDARTVDAYGYSIGSHDYARQLIVNRPQEKVEFITIYPNGAWYSKDCCPVKSSSYGLENLIQIKVTKRGDKIVKKEFV